MDFQLSDSEKRLLLTVARDAIAGRLSGRESPLPEGTPRLQATGSAFVSLHLDHELRGCIGDLQFARPLLQSVHDNALSAAFRDPRFPELTMAELAAVEIEISCLSPPREVTSADAIEIGRHGVILEKSGRRAVFLPQVAPDYGWDVPTTLNQLCRKAGLANDAWRTGATLEVFEAIVFSEA